MNDRLIVVAGAASPAGEAVVRRLAEAGARVIAADVRPTNWDHPRVDGIELDLLDAAGTRAWAAGVAREHGRVDGLIHLVGGWRGAKTFAGADLDDWAFLHDMLIRTLQHTTLAFCEHLAQAPAGRAVIVSQTGVPHPTQGNAAYAAAKAAAETWMLALADSYAGTGAASTILAVKALLTDEMRARKPEKAFPGFTHVNELADVVAGLWDRPAAELNGNRLDLTIA